MAAYFAAYVVVGRVDLAKQQVAFQEAWHIEISTVSEPWSPALSLVRKHIPPFPSGLAERLCAQARYPPTEAG